MFLNLAPVDSNPSITTRLNRRVGIELRIRGGAYLCDLRSIGVSGEEKNFDIGLISG